MANKYSAEDILGFLDHASEHGLMPTTTAQSLAVAARNVFGILSDDERADLNRLDLNAVIKRFNNRRAKDFNPSSLKEYGRRVHRAIDLYTQWSLDPANFSAKTRATNTARRKERGANLEGDLRPIAEVEPSEPAGSNQRGSYQSAFPIRPGTVVTLSNVPSDLTATEAERLAQFVKMLVIT